MNISKLINLGDEILNAIEGVQLRSEIAMISMESIHNMIVMPRYNNNMINSQLYKNNIHMQYQPFQSMGFTQQMYEAQPPPFSVDDPMMQQQFIDPNNTSKFYAQAQTRFPFLYHNEWSEILSQNDASPEINSL